MLRLESRCSKLILDCIDWNHDGQNSAEVANAYDLLYQLYCAKLTAEGLPLSHEQQLR